MDTSHNEAGVAQPGKRSWRRHSTEFKSKVIDLARQRHASVAAVALANGLNANMLRRWVRQAQLAAGEPRVAAPGTTVGLPAFVAVAVLDGGQPAPTVAQAEASSVASMPCSVVVEIRRGATTVHASLALDERSAAWLREVLG
jgi:transposase-like protein